jgi:hypothetical protein
MYSFAKANDGSQRSRGTIENEARQIIFAYLPTPLSRYSDGDVEGTDANTESWADCEITSRGATGGSRFHSENVVVFAISIRSSAAFMNLDVAFVT